MVEENGKSGLFLPRWFLTVVGTAATIFTSMVVPWAVWVSVALLQVKFTIDSSVIIAIKVEDLHKQVNELDRKIIKNAYDILRSERRLDSIEGTRKNP